MPRIVETRIDSSSVSVGRSRELAELYHPLQLDDDTTDATREAESAHRDHPKLSASAPLFGIWTR